MASGTKSTGASSVRFGPCGASRGGVVTRLRALTPDEQALDLDRLLAANARARRRALAAASRRGVVAVIRAQRLTGPAAWLALAVHAQAVTR